MSANMPFCKEKTLALYSLCHSHNASYHSDRILIPIKFLVAQGADLNWKNETDGGRTAFIHSAINNKYASSEGYDLLSYFLMNGAEPNYFSQKGLCAFWIIANRECPEKSYDLLRQYGANPYLKNNQSRSKTAFDYVNNASFYLTLLKNFPPTSRRAIKACQKSSQKFQDIFSGITNLELYQQIQVFLDIQKNKMSLEKEIVLPSPLNLSNLSNLSRRISKI